MNYQYHVTRSVHKSLYEWDVIAAVYKKEFGTFRF